MACKPCSVDAVPNTRNPFDLANCTAAIPTFNNERKTKLEEIITF